MFDYFSKSLYAAVFSVAKLTAVGFNCFQCCFLQLQSLASSHEKLHQVCSISCTDVLRVLGD